MVKESDPTGSRRAQFSFQLQSIPRLNLAEPTDWPTSLPPFLYGHLPPFPPFSSSFPPYPRHSWTPSTSTGPPHQPPTTRSRLMMTERTSVLRTPTNSLRQPALLMERS